LYLYTGWANGKGDAQSAYATKAGAQWIRFTPVTAVATCATAPVSARSPWAAFAAVATAHRVDAGAQRIGLAARGGTARARIADPKAAQMGVGPRLAVLAWLAVFPWTPVFAGSTVVARGAFNAGFGVARLAGIGPVGTACVATTAAVATTSAAALATRRLALLLSSATWRAAFAGICCWALSLASAAAASV